MNMQPAPLLDYVFLSDPGGNAIFLVERDGLVWRYDETLPPGQPHGKRRQVLKDYRVLDWTECLHGPTAWNWHEGWLPILELTDSHGSRLRLMADGECLLVEFPDGVCRSYPGGEEITADTFVETCINCKHSWIDWFGYGRQLPRTHSFWDNAWKSSWVQAKSIYADRHPRYGTGTYTEARSDGFPPTTLSMVSALLTYEHDAEARETLGYYLRRFVLPDGRIDYYGPAISEYGALLALTARIMHETHDGRTWLLDHLSPVQSLFRYLIRCRIPVLSAVDKVYGLIQGSPEADTRSDTGAFFHNNMHVWRGFTDISRAFRELGLISEALEAEYHADDLARRLRRAIQGVRPSRGPLPSRVDREEKFTSLTESLESAYVNYRYYPEMLETGFLDREDALRIIEARETLGGELDGTTVFASPEIGERLDDWPICSYAKALLELGETERFQRVLNGHATLHSTPDTFTAYEQVYQNGSPRQAAADWCVPSQLALPRMLAWSFDYTTRQGETLRLGGPRPCPE